MSSHHLATYLNDHLAGSAVGLELLEYLERSHAGTPLADFGAVLRAEIAEDRRELEALMARLQIAASGARQAAAWLSEKLTELKLRMDDRQGGALHRHELLEALSLGIEGKRLLWRALAAAAVDSPDLAGTDFGRLEQRAEDQRRRVEPFRLEAARSALGRDDAAKPRQTPET